jgi:hypothetical protein
MRLKKKNNREEPIRRRNSKVPLRHGRYSILTFGGGYNRTLDNEQG